MTLLEKYNSLIIDIEKELLSMIQQSTTKSEFMINKNVIKLDLPNKFDLPKFIELGLWNNELTLFNISGGRFSLYDLHIIDILFIIEKPI